MSDEGYKTSPVVGYVRSAMLNDPRLDEWEAQIRTYAAERGYNLVRVYREEATSGTRNVKPILQQILDSVHVGRYVGLITPSLAHLSSTPSAAARIVHQINHNAWIQFLVNLQE